MAWDTSDQLRRLRQPQRTYILYRQNLTLNVLVWGFLTLAQLLSCRYSVNAKLHNFQLMSTMVYGQSHSGIILAALAEETLTNHWSKHQTKPESEAEASTKTAQRWWQYSDPASWREKCNSGNGEKCVRGENQRDLVKWQLQPPEKGSNSPSGMMAKQNTSRGDMNSPMKPEGD